MREITDPNIVYAKLLYGVMGREGAIAYLRETWNIDSTNGLECLIKWVNHFAFLDPLNEEEW